jgi:hypothetical protein
MRVSGWTPRTTAPQSNLADVLKRIHREFSREELDEFDRLVREERRRTPDKALRTQ